MKDNEINVNNVVDDTVYTLSEPRPTLKKGVAQCDFCFMEFASFTLLYKHKAKSCYEDGIFSEPFPNPVRVTFEKEQLYFIKDILDSINTTIHQDENDKCYFVVDRSVLEITLRRLYVGQVTKYNLEEWYAPLMELAKKNNKAKGFTKIPLSTWPIVLTTLLPK